MFRNRFYFGKAILVLTDLLVLCLSLFLALKLRFWFTGNHAYSFLRHIQVFLPHFAVWLIVFYLFDLYNLRQTKSAALNLSSLAMAVPINLALSVIIFYFFSAVVSPKTLLILTVALALAFLMLERFVLARLFKKKYSKRIVFVGGDAGRAQSISLAAKESENSYEVLGLVHLGQAPAFTAPDLPVLGDYRDLAQLTKRHGIEQIVCLFNYHENKDIAGALIDALGVGATVTELPQFFEEATGKIPVEAIDQIWFLSNIYGGRRLHAAATRFLDLAVGALGLLIFMIFLPLIAVFIKLDSSGPVFYSQWRVGRHDRPFKIHKLRTMKVDAEKAGAVWAQENDPRVTRAGRFLRKTRLDELPQLWNVLRGDMSLVGPRPERPEFVEMLKTSIPFYSRRHLVKPGLTGWAQIKYKYGASKEDALEKLQYDLFYIKNKSLLLDVMILVRTARIVMLRGGV